MAFTATSLADGQIAATVVTIYAPSGLKAIIKAVELFNTGAGSELVKLYVTRSGGTRRQLRQVSIGASGSASILTDGMTWILSDGDALEAETSTATTVDYVVMGATE